MAKNKVIDGDYKGSDVLVSVSTQDIVIKLEASEIPINKGTVVSCKSSANNAVGISFMVDLTTGKPSSAESCIWTVDVKFKDGKKSILEIDDNIHNILKRNFGKNS